MAHEAHIPIRRLRLICPGCGMRVEREKLKVSTSGPLHGHKLCPQCREGGLGASVPAEAA